MKRINLSKFGFIRTPEEDFFNDGAKFACYKIADRVRVGKAMDGDRVFITARISGLLTYQEYSRLEHYKDCNSLNGVLIENINDDILRNFADICKKYASEYIEAENAYINSLPNEREVRKYYNALKNKCEKEYNEAKSHFPVEVLMSIDETTVKFILRNLNILKSSIPNVEVCTADAMKNNSTLSYIKQKIQQNNITDSTYTYDTLIELSRSLENK